MACQPSGLKRNTKKNPDPLHLVHYNNEKLESNGWNWEYRNWKFGMKISFRSKPNKGSLLSCSARLQRRSQSAGNGQAAGA
jgi:hypothetical protein